MENEVLVLGNYVSGISNRPDLVNQPCILLYKEDGFIVSILLGEKAEPFKIPYNIVESCTSRERVVMSETMIDKSNNTEFNRDLLAAAILGPSGIMINNIHGVNKMFNTNNIGKVDYNNMFEVIVEYRTSERNKRLVINTYEEPSRIVNYYNSIKN